MDAVILIVSLISTIFILLISTVNSEAPAAGGKPGTSACGYYGVKDSPCNLEAVPVKDLPKECTAFFYESANVGGSDGGLIDITDNSGSDDLDGLTDLLSAKTHPVYVFYGYATQADWNKVISSKESTDKEIKSQGEFYKTFAGIQGIVLFNLEVVSKGADSKTTITNVNTYVQAFKAQYPQMQIALSLSAKSVAESSGAGIDFSCLNTALDFVVVTFTSDFNPCTAENKNGGAIPVSGSAGNTMTKVQTVLTELKVDKSKVYFRYQTIGSSPKADKSTKNMCTFATDKVCTDKASSADWCIETSCSLNEKGKFAKENAAGFIASTVDLNDPKSCCQCGKPFPSFYYLMDGYSGTTSSKPCPLFNRS